MKMHLQYLPVMRSQSVFKNLYFILTLFLYSCTAPQEPGRESIDLAGQWQFALDTLRTGEAQHWFLKNFDDSVQLPGTTDQNEKGFLNRHATTMHLNRIFRYEGAAWYRKEVEIPESFRDKHIALILERTRSTRIWVDSIPAGESRLLQAPQEFDLSALLTPGKHTLTIRVDNSRRLTPYGNVHIYSDDTQTNWNGILGKMCLEVSPGTRIAGVKVFPDIDHRLIRVRIKLDNHLQLTDAALELHVRKSVAGKTILLKPFKSTVQCRDMVELTYELGDDCSLWDEYAQPLYTLTVILSGGKIRDVMTVPFGMRKFAVKGSQFDINGRTVFLRGKHDAAVFPLTGYAPMDTEEWVRLFRIAKTYGINHYRFHSWCPPEAAFYAADREGIYLQAELPFWGGLESDTVAQRLRQEGMAMLDAYANHPSLVMFSHGNEIWSGHDRVEANIRALEEYDPRPLYTMGSNNNIGYVPPRSCSDFFVGARTPFAHDTTLTHARLTQAFADSRDGGILNTMPPSTEINFNYAVASLEIPLVGHETGQYQIFPDYREIQKYTGVLRATNLEIFRNRLEKAGMGHMDSLFCKASGAWAALCYKAEMEAALRTQGMAGFQLLDLQDFPGQGTALVGILDAFMESKNVITPEAWTASCSDVVLLPGFAKFVWNTGETFQAEMKVANYSAGAIHAPLEWKIRRHDGTLLEEGTFANLHIAQGGLTTAGEISVDLASVSGAEKLLFECSLEGTRYSNRYDLWVYPPAGDPIDAGEVLVTGELGKQALDQLLRGGKVLLFPRIGMGDPKAVPGLFPPEFWNYGMFKGISESNGKPVSPGTLSLLTDPQHPLFAHFPTDAHTNWQWFSIIKNSHSLILDALPRDYFPVVQVIDNLERNHKLGLIFEWKVGEGRLLVCMSPLDLIRDHPEAAQLYRSILNYMNSPAFKPEHQITESELTDWYMMFI
jgi:hypothetical protein